MGGPSGDVLGGSRKPRSASPRICQGRLGREPGFTHFWAVLLVALALRPPFVLPVEKAPDWYGISADTAQRGLASLGKYGVLKAVRTYKPVPLAPKGFTYDSRYTLQGAFHSDWGGNDGT